jgi:hypothetical protein
LTCSRERGSLALQAEVLAGVCDGNGDGVGGTDD